MEHSEMEASSGQLAAGRTQRSEIGGQMTEDRRQKTAAYQPLGTFVRSKESESRSQEKETKVTHLKLLLILNS